MRAYEQDAGDAAQHVHAVLGRHGAPLPPTVRVAMESRLGEDFGDVRVHADDRAAASAEAVAASAYTVGSDIVFGRGAYEPDTETGRRVLAHELSHVAQQRSGAVAGTPVPGTDIAISSPDDAFERAAEARAGGSA